MAVSESTQWVIVACGIIAHADGVLEGSECDRLLSMIDEELDDADYSDWLALIGDAGALQAKLDALPTPGPDEHRDVLERAWAMAMVDGERCDAEIEALYGLADRIGVDRVQVDFWREAWTTNERGFSTSACEAAVILLGGGGPLVGADINAFEDLVERLPTSNDHRDRLRKTVVGADMSASDCGQNLAALPRRRRMRLLRLLAGLVGEAGDRDGANRRFHEVCAGAGVLEKDARRLISAASRSLLG